MEPDPPPPVEARPFFRVLAGILGAAAIVGGALSLRFLFHAVFIAIGLAELGFAYCCIKLAATGRLFGEVIDLNGRVRRTIDHRAR
jgi:hypothetical protein